MAARPEAHPLLRRPFTRHGGVTPEAAFAPEATFAPEAALVDYR